MKNLFLLSEKKQYEAIINNIYDINTLNEWGNNILYQCQNKAKSKKQIERYFDYVNLGANIHNIDYENQNLLFFYSNIDNTILSFLIENGLNINQVNNSSFTPLLAANGCLSLLNLKTFLENGSDPYYSIEQFNNKHNNIVYKNPLSLSCLLGEDSLEKIKFMLSYGISHENDNHLLFHFINQNKDVFLYLLGLGLDPLIKDDKGNTLLHSFIGWHSFMCSDGDLEIIDVLIKAGVEVNARNDEGFTALMMSEYLSDPWYSSPEDNIEPYDLDRIKLIQLGADPYITSNNGFRIFDILSDNVKSYCV